MGRIGRMMWLVIFAVLLPMGCSEDANVSTPTDAVPVVRVRLLENLDAVQLSASTPPTYYTESDRTMRVLSLPRNTPIGFSYQGIWHVGNAMLGSGTLTVIPSEPGTVSVNGQPYRGSFRLVPVGANKIDVINDVDVESYLAGVLPKELPRDWHIETYKAQAIVARTYVLYQHQMAVDRYWDVYPDQRSQMYGGIAAESAKSRQAVADTRGVLVVYGKPGEEHIFEAYFCSCCGGVTQSATDAFGDPYIEPLSDQNNQSLCRASPNFNWGPVVIRKDELTRRFKLWGQKRNVPEKDMGMIARIDVQTSNRWDRPVRFLITDARGIMYSLSGEELRRAVNTESTDTTMLKSSFVKVISDSDTIRFVEGHGYGHGVGMCQYCAEARAESGMSHEDIVLAAFQRAVLKRAY